MLRFPTLRLASTAVLLLALLAAPVGAGAQADQSGGDPRFFAQTGFRVDHDAFWTFFQRRGGVRTFGYPVSRQFKLLGFPVQIFQREVMQLQPDGSVQTLNLLDPGLMPYTHINASVFPAPDPAVVGATPAATSPTYAADIITFVTAQTTDTFEGQPVNFQQTFNTTVTYQDAFPNNDGPESLVPLLNLQLWGAPTSKPAYDPGNHNFIYQRFQRGIMHYDKGCNCTQGLLLADYLKSLLTGQNLPGDLAAQARGDHSRFLNQYAPGKPLSLARPDELPGSDLTSAFDKQQPVAGGGTPVATPASGTFAYGLQVQMWHYDQGGKQLVVNLAKGAGFGWVKHQVEWQTVEPRQTGEYDWEQLDQIVNTASGAGEKVLLSVAHAPAFLRGPNSGLMPADPSTYQALLQTMATRYAGKVQAYELWNEENLALEAGPGNVDPSTYLPLLKAGYAGVKNGDPSALVLLGAPSPTGANVPGQVMDDVSYLNALYAINGGEVKGYFDALAAHPSGFSTPPDCGPDTPQCSLSGGFNNDPSFFAFYRVGQYHDLLAQNGDPDKKIWFTEFGYCSNPTPPKGYEYCASLSEDAQARFTTRAFQKARSLEYVGGMILWNLNMQVSVPQTDEKWGFGIIRSDWSPRPAYSALASMPKP